MFPLPHSSRLQPRLLQRLLKGLFQPLTPLTQYFRPRNLAKRGRWSHSCSMSALTPRPAKEKHSSEGGGGLTAPLTAGAVGSLAQSSCPWAFASAVLPACPLTASRSQLSVIPGLTVHSTEHNLTHLLVYRLSLSPGRKLHRVLQLYPHCREQFWAHGMHSTNMC